MIFFFLSALLANTNAVEFISVYGDVHKDVEFFTRTFPWIIDNIGGDLVVEYSLIGSGRYSVPQMCALEDLKLNTFLQAQYLKCEAEGKPGGYCLCEAGIDPKTFKQCVASGGYLASTASAKYTELGFNFTPIIELIPNNTVYGVDDISFLHNICNIFGDNLPRGCVNYSNQTESFPDEKALAQFDRACHKEFPISDDDDKPVSPEPESTTRTTTPPSQRFTTSTTTPSPWGTTTTITQPPCNTSPTTTPPPWSTTSTTTPPTWGTTTPPPWSTTTTERVGEGTRPYMERDHTTPSPWSTTTTITQPPCNTSPTTTPPPWSTTTTERVGEGTRPYMENEENIAAKPAPDAPRTPEISLE